MSAHVLEGPWWNEHGSKLFKCSACHSSVACNAVQPAYFKFCWNCGVKFGPEPKAEPTQGEWYYDVRSSKIFARRSYGYASDVFVADVTGDLKEIQANGLVLAASKKLLASLKIMTATSIPIAPTARELVQAREAIAAAEGK